MKLTGAAILVSRGTKVLQAPADYPYRSASWAAALARRPSSAAGDFTRALETYTNAIVAWADTSVHGTIALRPGGGQVSHFCEFANPKGLMIGVAAGLAGKKVDCTTTGGETGGFWRNVNITKFH